MASAVPRFLRRGNLRWILLLGALGIEACWLLGRDADPVPPPSADDLDRTYGVEALHADLEHLVDAIAEIHPEPWFQFSREAFQADVETVRAALDAPLTRTAFFLRIAPLIARLGDGHTGVQLPMPEIRRHVTTGGLLFPLKLRFVSGRAIVSRSFGGIAAGAEVVSINGQPMDDIRARFADLFGSQREVHRLALVETYFPYLMWLAYGSRSEFRVRVAGLDSAGATSRMLAAHRQPLCRPLVLM